MRDWRGSSRAGPIRRVVWDRGVHFCTRGSHATRRSPDRAPPIRIGRRITRVLRRARHRTRAAERRRGAPTARTAHGRSEAPRPAGRRSHRRVGGASRDATGHHARGLCARCGARSARRRVLSGVGCRSRQLESRTFRRARRRGGRRRLPPGTRASVAGRTRRLRGRGSMAGRERDGAVRHRQARPRGLLRGVDAGDDNAATPPRDRPCRPVPRSRTALRHLRPQLDHARRTPDRRRVLPRGVRRARR